ncbi:hypothetical protein OsI_18606 [Oryza sativa Indica Group]|uniref:Uncharacterized protein n=1 Tax=Oryza sativa subsp. indica TaxID=39946 RepID=A2Y0S5_ORYSI|nr:hypothetical protein OsI_18606 [Oryza sativa Indica Group]
MTWVGSMQELGLEVVKRNNSGTRTRVASIRHVGADLGQHGGRPRKAVEPRLFPDIEHRLRFLLHLARPPCTSPKSFAFVSVLPLWSMLASRDHIETVEARQVN